MNLESMLLINVVMIPVTTLLDYVFLKKTIEKELHEPAKWYHFLPACFLELMIFNAGLIIGAKVG